MTPKPHMIAMVTFLTRDEGGWSQRHWSGVKPALKVKNGTFTSCIVWGQSEDQMFEPGVEYEVRLELLVWKDYCNEVYSGMPVQLNEGSRVVGRGSVVAIIAEQVR